MTEKPSDKNHSDIENHQYTLDNPPSLQSPGFIIEYAYLRKIKTGNIPNLKELLDKFNQHDWTNLLAHNPRQEFLKFLYLLDKSIIAEIDWRFVIETIKSARNT